MSGKSCWWHVIQEVLLITVLLKVNAIMVSKWKTTFTVLSLRPIVSIFIFNTEILPWEPLQKGNMFSRHFLHLHRYNCGGLSRKKMHSNTDLLLSFTNTVYSNDRLFTTYRNVFTQSQIIRINSQSNKTVTAHILYVWYSAHASLFGRLKTQIYPRYNIDRINHVSE